MDEDAPKLQVRLVGRDGRRRYDPASRDQLVAACLEYPFGGGRLAWMGFEFERAALRLALRSVDAG